jgi:transposase
MSLHPQPFPALPEDTARVAKAAFKRKDNVYVTIGDQLGSLFADDDFAELYAADGKPAVSPNLLALVTVFQFMENLPDRDAADAVRARIDWKYALHLALADMGFDASILSEFRARLGRHAAAQQMFERVLRRLQDMDLLRKGGKQRTDATAVLAATRTLNRVQLVAETMRLALEALAPYRPDWLRSIALPHWYERYSLVLTDFRLPRAKAKQEALALDIGRDGFHLLDALHRPDVPSQAATLPETLVLAQIWQQQFERHADGPRWRTKADKAPAGQVLTTPHDPEVRFTAHGDKTWNGYQVHWTETCDAERPHVITHVATTATDTRDVELVPEIHADLQRLDLLPSAHWVDGGYTSGPNVVESRQRYGVRLIGPLAEDGSWQARTPGGLTLDQFQIDFQQRQATCPQGQVSARWAATTGADGHSEVQVEFPKAICQTCAVRQYCTKSTDRGRTLQLSAAYAAIQAGRQHQQTDAFRREYTLRAGIEGTVSAMVRQHGARRTRYRTSTKTHIQSLLIAIAANVRRAALWLMGYRPGTTRPPSLNCLAPIQLAA